MSTTRRRFVASLATLPLTGRLPFTQSVPDQQAPATQRQPREHVVVIGAGAFGGWTALSLLRAGARVTLLDAYGAGSARATSGGETRVIRAVYNGDVDYITMVARAFTLWREAEQRWQRRLYHRTGALWMFEGDDAFARTSAAPMRAKGLELRDIGIAAAAKTWPQIRFDGVRKAFVEKEAGYLLARVSCELVREAVVREGGEYRVAHVKPGTKAGKRLTNIAVSRGGTLSADRFVFACGPWMGKVFPDVVGPRIVATRQEVFFLGTPAGSTQWDDPAFPVWVNFGERLMYGMPGNERRGFKIADDTLGAPIDPDTMERIVTPASITNLRALVRRRFPGLTNAPIVETRVCQYEYSADGHFLIDRHPELENVWLLGGGSGHGFKMGPALGEHAAAVVQGRSPVIPKFAYARLRNATSLPSARKA
ncbi:MAG: FAD-dependent oxidoreductase [Gemmatimonadaceae bacterium]